MKKTALSFFFVCCTLFLLTGCNAGKPTPPAMKGKASCSHAECPAKKGKPCPHCQKQMDKGAACSSCSSCSEGCKSCPGCKGSEGCKGCEGCKGEGSDRACNGCGKDTGHGCMGKPHAGDGSGKSCGKKPSCSGKAPAASL